MNLPQNSKQFTKVSDHNIMQMKQQNSEDNLNNDYSLLSFCTVLARFVNYTIASVICLMRINNLCKGCANVGFCCTSSHFRFQRNDLHKGKRTMLGHPFVKFRFTFKMYCWHFVWVINKSDANLYGLVHVAWYGQQCCSVQAKLIQFV